jgi:DNA-binding NarL/FixJ family response regulator
MDLTRSGGNSGINEMEIEMRELGSSGETPLVINRTCQGASAVIVSDRDAMSSDVLAATLRRELHCHAAAIPPENLVHALQENQVGVLVIGADLENRSGSGLDLARTVDRLYPQVFVVILLSSSKHASVVDAFRCGARGVFSRERPISELIECITHVQRGYIWAGGPEASALIEALRTLPSSDSLVAGAPSLLSERELQIVRYASTGKTNKIIAHKLRLSEHTVKNHLFRAFEKLGVSSRVELLFYLTTTGLKRDVTADIRSAENAITEQANA